MADTAKTLDEDEGQHIRHAGQDAGQDTSIRERLKRNPEDPDAKLDAGSDESMDASDPPAVTIPGGSEPAPSSGFDEAAERAR